MRDHTAPDTAPSRAPQAAAGVVAADAFSADAEHEVVAVDARPLFERGGGIHCITQQQPSPLRKETVA